MMNSYSELALENLRFWNSQSVNFSHDAPLGTVKGNRQKVGWRSYDIKPYDKDHPLLCKPGNIVLYQNRNGEIVQGYVLKYISDYAILDSIEGKSKKVSVRKILEIYRDYFDYFSKFGKTTVSTEYKVKKLQEIHSILQYCEKGDKFAPKSAIFMKIGAFDYDWPADLGIKKGTEKPLYLPKNKVIRVGYLGGNCFSNKVNTYDELAVPYQFNPYANKEVYFSTWMYKEKIDAIKDNNIEQLNRILEYQGIPKVSEEIFEVLRYDYGKYLKQVRKSKLNFYPIDYGVKGLIAPWYDSDGNLILKGGAIQYSTPLNGINLRTIGVVRVKKAMR